MSSNLCSWAFGSDSQWAGKTREEQVWRMFEETFRKSQNAMGHLKGQLARTLQKHQCQGHKEKGVRWEGGEGDFIWIKRDSKETSIPSSAQWQYCGQWGLSNVWLSLSEQFPNPPPQATWNTAGTGGFWQSLWMLREKMAYKPWLDSAWNK